MKLVCPGWVPAVIPNLRLSRPLAQSTRASIRGLSVVVAPRRSTTQATRVWELATVHNATAALPTSVARRSPMGIFLMPPMQLAVVATVLSRHHQATRQSSTPIFSQPRTIVRSAIALPMLRRLQALLPRRRSKPLLSTIYRWARSAAKTAT